MTEQKNMVEIGGQRVLSREDAKRASMMEALS